MNIFEIAFTLIAMKYTLLKIHAMLAEKIRIIAYHLLFHSCEFSTHPIVEQYVMAEVMALNTKPQKPYKTDLTCLTLTDILGTGLESKVCNN